MSLDKGTLVTHYAYEDETETFGSKTCFAFEADSRDEADPQDVCVGIILKISYEGIFVRWAHFCPNHEKEHTPLGWFNNNELWEIGQIL